VMESNFEIVSDKFNAVAICSSGNHTQNYTQKLIIRAYNY